MNETQIKELLIRVFDDGGYGYPKYIPTIKSEFIGWHNYTVVEIDDIQILLNYRWIEKYRENFEYWGYDKETEFANLMLRAYCVIIGKPQENKIDLPVGIGIARMMVSENLLIGIKFRKKENTLFGEDWGEIIELTGPAPQLIYAFNKK